MQQQQAGGPPEQPPRPNAMPVLLEGAAGGFAQQSQGVPWPAIPTPEDLEFYSRGKQRRKLYRDLKLLGSGAEGKVKLSQNLETGQLVALKSMTKPPLPFTPGLPVHMSDSIQRKLYVRQKAEREIRKRYRVMESHNGHPHLPFYMDFFETREKWYIVSSICQGGDLLSYVQRQGSHYLAEPTCQQVTAIILSTLAYLHRHDVAHRDLKPTNVLLRDPNNVESLCLVDFGSSFVTHEKEDAGPDVWSAMPTGGDANASMSGSGSSIGSPAPDTSEQPYLPDNSANSTGGGPDMKTLTGTPFYLAPEIVEGRRYTQKVDVWALGCVVFQLLYARTPFQDAASFPELFSRICKADFQFPDVVPAPSEQARDFVSTVLQVDPAKRPTAEEALRHPWVAGWAAQYATRR